ncbi:hypothetical protein I7I50_01639 [Histoplasma capsulatum G186AR]|uniref:Uncharacterized protein n=1 Tax=Ajellomyces capsulatus TaxID=5037 RepID=A0A8H7YF14_AJECA|nr:hypothetical protein I7I52_11855 [Histoplasma capsulatum]QSS70965.1 hypothetical protein I7I50_01639 [Histoplasma capsulatum G186AR]
MLSCPTSSRRTNPEPCTTAVDILESRPKSIGNMCNRQHRGTVFRTGIGLAIDLVSNKISRREGLEMKAYVLLSQLATVLSLMQRDQ